MRRTETLQQVAVWLAVVVLCVPQAAVAGNQSVKQAPVIVDVALRDGGVLLGQVVDTQGSPLAGAAVLLRSGDRELATSKTDGAGLFGFRGLRSGVYQVLAAKGQGTYRLWPQRTAPPSAKRGALIVVGEDTIRGQRVARTYPNLIEDRLVIAVLIATAIAVPVAIYNADRSSS